MAIGMSLCIGVNRYSEEVYGIGYDLNDCENDANAMLSMAHDRGFWASLLLNERATRSAVTDYINEAAEVLKEGDIFMFGFSGHGKYLHDHGGEEPDSMNEGICLYDGELIDDEINQLLSHFKPKVRVVFLTDSCHSESLTRKKKEDHERKPLRTKDVSFEGMGKLNKKGKSFTWKKLPDRNKKKLGVRSKRELFAQIQENPPETNGEPVKAAVLQLAACKDYQTSHGGEFYSLFTEAVVNVWKDGNCTDNYEDFLKAIIVFMRNKYPNVSQEPCIFWCGPEEERFEDEAVLIIDRPE